MTAFAILLLCLGAGALVTRSRFDSDRLAGHCDGWVLNVALPAMVLVQIPRLQPDATLWFPVLAPWVVIGGALLCFPLIGRRLGWSQARVGCLIMTCGFGNTAFLGLPMVAALRGESALPIAVVADQAGSFLALTTIGLAVASGWIGERVPLAQRLARVIRFPPFLALLLALLVAVFWAWPVAMERLLDGIAMSLAPVALFSVGLRFRLRAVSGSGGAMAVGLGWKLLIAPGLMALLAAAVGVSGEPVQVGVLQAGMAPMITAAILAMRNELEPRLAASILSIGILCSFATVPIWNRVL